MADCTVSLAKRQGSVYVANLALKSILHMPNLKCNLLSMSKLNKDMDCMVAFFPSHCEFQELSSGKTIGSAEENNSLYYISGSYNSSKSGLQNKSSFSAISDSEIM